MPDNHPGFAESLENLDLKHIAFPSDQVTVKKLRALHPELFDQNFGMDAPPQPNYLLNPEVPGHATENAVGAVRRNSAGTRCRGV